MLHDSFITFNYY